jgi:hypothetical protein
MYDIPLDLVRRFERRWAARFPGLTKEHRLKSSGSINGAPTKANEKPAGVDSART